MLNIKLSLSGLLAISLAATFASSSHAAVCKFRSSSGTCLLWSSGSTIGEFKVSQVTKDGDTAGIKIEEYPAGADDPLSGLNGLNGVLLCQNPGNDPSLPPGIQLVPNYIDGLITPYGDEGIVDPQPDGKYAVDNPVKYTAKAGLSEVGQLLCPNTVNWAPVGYVSCSIKAKAFQRSGGVESDSKTQYCYLKECGSLGYALNSAGEFKFDSRTYICPDAWNVAQ